VPGEFDRAIMDSNSGSGATQNANLLVAAFIGNGSVGTGAFTGGWDDGGQSLVVTGNCSFGGTFNVTLGAEVWCGSFDSSAATFNYGTGRTFLTGNPGILKTVPGGAFAERLYDLEIVTGAVINLQNNIGLAGFLGVDTNGKFSNPSASRVLAVEAMDSSANPLNLQLPIAEDWCGGTNILLALFSSPATAYNVPGAVYTCNLYLEEDHAGTVTATALGDIRVDGTFVVAPAVPTHTIVLSMGAKNLTLNGITQIGGGSADGTTDAGAITFTTGTLLAQQFAVWNRVSYLVMGSSALHTFSGGYDSFSRSASWNGGTGVVSFFSTTASSFHINGAGPNLPVPEFRDVTIGSNAGGDWRLLHDFNISGVLMENTLVDLFTWNGAISYNLTVGSLSLSGPTAIDTRNSTITTSSWFVTNGGYYFFCRINVASPTGCVSAAKVRFVGNGTIYGGGQTTYGDFWNLEFAAGSSISYLNTFFVGNQIWVNGTVKLDSPDYNAGFTKGFGTNAEACSTCVYLGATANLNRSGIFLYRNSGTAGKTLQIASGTYNDLFINANNTDVVQQGGNVTTVCNFCAPNSYVDGEMILFPLTVPGSPNSTFTGTFAYYTNNYSLTVAGVFFVGDVEDQSIIFHAGSSSILAHGFNLRGTASKFYAENATITAEPIGSVLPGVAMYIVSLPPATGHAIFYGNNSKVYVDGDLRLFEPGDIIDVASSRWTIGANYGAFASQMVFYNGAKLLMAPGSTLNIPIGFKIDATNGNLGWNGTAGSLVRLNATGAWTLTLNAFPTGFYVHYVAVNGSVSNRVVHNCVGGLDNGGNSQWFFPGNQTCSVETLPVTVYSNSATATLNGFLHVALPPYVTVRFLYGTSPVLTNASGDIRMTSATSFSTYIQPTPGSTVYFRAIALDQNGTVFSEGEILSFTMPYPPSLPDVFAYLWLVVFVFFLILVLFAALWIKGKRSGGL